MKASINFRISFLLIFIAFNTFSQEKFNLPAKIDSLLKIEHPRKFNGVVLVSKKRKIIYKKAVGYSNFKDKVPMQEGDNFIIMSNSKQITAVLILLQVQKKRIDLNHSVKEYLPELNLSWADSVTIHHLLNFSSGIVDLKEPLIYKPGTDFNYGNITYILLGKILERVTGKKYIDLAIQLFKSLRLKNTYCLEKNEFQNYVQGYQNVSNVFHPDYSGIENEDLISAAGIISNIFDLNRWDRLLHTGKILKPEIYKLMIDYRINSYHNAFEKEKIGYGYGLRISDKTKIKYLGHTGSGSGFISYKIYFPDNQIDLIILENQTNENPSLNYEFGIKIKELIMKSILSQN
ncbi:MAG: serine hydrolase [Cyclobacteriaceae bacterium]|nr:serine hydrolase [Cyclobacteriaceae bacterium]